MTGPVSERLQQQDTKLLEIEAAVQQMRDDQTQHITQISKQQSLLEEQVKHHSQQTNQSIDWLRSEQTVLQRTVTDAMQQHEHKLTQTFEDLKHLITEQRGKKRGPAKPAPEKEDHDDMESESGIL